MKAPYFEVGQEVWVRVKVEGIKAKEKKWSYSLTYQKDSYPAISAADEVDICGTKPPIND